MKALMHVPDIMKASAALGAMSGSAQIWWQVKIAASAQGAPTKKEEKEEDEDEDEEVEGEEEEGGDSCRPTAKPIKSKIKHEERRGQGSSPAEAAVAVPRAWALPPIARPRAPMSVTWCEHEHTPLREPTTLLRLIDVLFQQQIPARTLTENLSPAMHRVC